MKRLSRHTLLRVGLLGYWVCLRVIAKQKIVVQGLQNPGLPGHRYRHAVDNWTLFEIAYAISELQTVSLKNAGSPQFQIIKTFK
jgi:hypothetical protein